MSAGEITIGTRVRQGAKAGTVVASVGGWRDWVLVAWDGDRGTHPAAREELEVERRVGERRALP